MFAETSGEDTALANALLASENSVLRSRVDVLEAKLERAERIVERVRQMGTLLLKMFGLSRMSQTSQVYAGPGEHAHNKGARIM